MKTTILNLKIIIPLLMLIMAVESPARELPSSILLSEESYIDDIPFDTRNVVFHSGIYPYVLPEEDYVNDIPFNTGEVAGKAGSDSISGLKEETYIDDIPFSTEKVVNEYLLAKITDEYRDEPEARDNVSEDCQKNAACRMYFSQHVSGSIPTMQLIRISEMNDYIMIAYPGKDKEQIFRIQSISVF